jgi:cellulose synthase/poly-beta-1,6-N-acetylglucosamine synthase-like glycosyltransferase
MLASFAVIAALIEPSFPRMTYLYGREVRHLAGDESLRLPRQASIAIRPLFLALLALFAGFGAGRWRDRLRLAVLAVGTYVPVIVATDVVLARLGRYGAPSPFEARGNLIVGVIGVLVAAVVVFASARLPGNVHVRRRIRRARWRLLVLGASIVSTALAVALALHVEGGRIAAAARIPLLGGVGSVVVLFIALLPAVICSYGATAGLIARVRRRRRGPMPRSAAFIVPAHNEEGMIGDCIRALDAAAAGWEGEVAAYIVENGSTDATPFEAAQALAECPHLHGEVVTAPPLGKSRALNVGLACCTQDVVVRIDADTLVTPQLLAQTVPHFADPDVGGVGVLPLPRSNAGWIGPMRALETYYGVAFKRVAQGVVDAVTVLPGATVAYRRDLLVELSGFAEGVNGEDADITVRVGRLGYRIVSDHRIRVHTDVPRNLGQLREQRIRWSRGLYHMVARNRSAIWGLQGVRGAWMLPWAAFVMFRKLMLIPLAVAAVGMIAAHPSTLPLREVTAAGAILLGVQLVQMTIVLAWYRRLDLIAFVPAYLVFRLIVTYYALETLLTLSLVPERAARHTRPQLQGG